MAAAESAEDRESVDATSMSCTGRCVKSAPEAFRITAVARSAARTTHTHISNIDKVDAFGHIVLDLLVFTDPGTRIGLGDLDQAQSSICSPRSLSMAERACRGETCRGEQEATDTLKMHDAWTGDGTLCIAKQENPRWARNRYTGVILWAPARNKSSGALILLVIRSSPLRAWWILDKTAGRMVCRSVLARCQALPLRGASFKMRKVHP